MSTGFSGFSSGCTLESSWLSGCGLCSAWVHPTRSRWLYPTNLVLPTVPTLFPAKLEYLLQLDEICYLWKALPRGRPLWCKQKRHTWLLSLSLSYRIIIYEYPLVEHNQEKKKLLHLSPPHQKKKDPMEHGSESLAAGLQPSFGGSTNHLLNWGPWPMPCWLWLPKVGGLNTSRQ